jgi:hypothetical protein
LDVRARTLRAATRRALLILAIGPRTNMSLTRQEASDLAAYIATQAKGP